MTSLSKNISGENGVINKTGRIGSSSTILCPNDDDFFQNIESGILSTVQLLVYNGITTFSSCQGHSDNSSRNVGIILEKTNVHRWANYIAYLNDHYSLENPIEAIVVHVPRCELTKKYVDPVGLVISFGIPNINELSTSRNQSLFNGGLNSVDSFQNEDKGKLAILSKNITHHNQWSSVD